MEWKSFDAGAAAGREGGVRVERMAYGAPGTVSVPARAPAVEAEGASREELEAAVLELRAGMAEAERFGSERLEQARREGREGVEQVLRRAEQQSRAALESDAARLGAALESFRAEREDYFAKVEREVVLLALAIAARILRREAALDPLLLSGAVRVALGQLGETTGVRLRCPPEQAERWREMLRLLPDPASPPEVAADAELAAGECVLETAVGSVDLGVRAQLAEIESGFFDLLERRPAAGARSVSGAAG
jgi:flagellar assembly protein FliH